MSSFSRKIIDWQRRHGRHGLPWQGTRDPYVIWVSEIMLQQTQVTTVIPYFNRFIARFPDVAALASASDDEVMQHWSGLGYYSRARNLLKAARVVMDRHRGKFPTAFVDLVELPGIGESTAGAIAAFSSGEIRPILDGNVKRVLARCFAIPGYPGTTETARALWEVAGSLMPKSDVEAYTQGMMDLGSTLCLRSRPLCAACPVADVCVARKEGRVAEFPGRKPRKEVPRRSTAMLILRRGSKVFLEKRPPTGIWGGLWCLPETPHAGDIAPGTLARFGVRVKRADALVPFEHQFTHFHLTITPLLCDVAELKQSAREREGAWLPLDEALAVGLPAPVKRILESIARDESRDRAK